MTPERDESLPLGSPAAPPGVVGDAASVLTLVGQAEARPYLLEGERTLVRGEERRGPASVWVDGRAVLEALDADQGLGVNVVVSPSLLRRECVGARGSVLETVLALPTLPMVAFQWSGAGEAELSFTLLPDAADLRYHAAGRTLRAEPVDGDGGVELLLHPAPEAWQITEAPEGGLQVRATVPSSGTATLLVAAGPSSTTARALEAGAHLGAHAIRATTDQDPSNTEGLLPFTGVPEVDQGVGWASLRLAGALRRGDPGDPVAWFWAAVGALAAGDAVGALSGAGRLREAAQVPLPGIGGRPAPGAALWVYLTARSTLLSGDETPAQRALAALPRATLEEHRLGADPAAWSWWTLALGTLADALRYGASQEEIQGVRDVAARPPGQAPRTLPMFGSGPAPGSAGWFGALLRGEGLAGPPPSTLPPGLAPWCALASGDVEGGYTGWRALVADGLEGATGPRGDWSPPGEGPAMVMATLAFGLLGLEPDAPSGRVRIAPILPAHLKRFGTRGIRVGKARLSLDYEREGRMHRFSVTPLDGPVPPAVVLEPSIPCAAVGEIRMDGVPAELTSERRGTVGRYTRVQVQFAADAPRVLEIDEG